jgi:signal transduction histidine kinase
MPALHDPARPATSVAEGPQHGARAQASGTKSGTRHAGKVRLEALEEIATALAMTRAPEDVAAVVTRVAAKALGAVAASIRLLRPDGMLERLAEPGGASHEPFVERDIPVSAVDLVSDAVRHGIPVRVEAPDEGMKRYPDLWRTVHARGVRAAIALPLQIQGRTIGVLSVSFGQPHCFTGREQRFIGAVAGLTVQALDRARLYVMEQERAQAAEELARLRQQQAEEARAVAAMSSALTSTLEPSQLYALILEQAAKALPCDHSAVMLYEDGWAVVAASWGMRTLPRGTRVFPVAAIASIMAYGASGKPALIADTRSINWIEVPPFTGEMAIRSTLVVPLLLDNAVVGTFNIDSYTPNFYTDRHLALAVALGERIGQALRNARLYVSEQARAQTAEELARLRQEQAEEAEVLAQVSSDLAGTLEPAQLYQRILSQVSRIIPCDHAAVVLHQDNWAVLAAIWGEPHLPVGMRLFRLADDDPELLATLSAGRAVLIHDTAEMPTWIAIPPFTGASTIRSILFVPLLLEGSLVGTLNVASFKPGFYGPRHVALAVRFAGHVAHALLNARLYQAEQERARAAEALVQLRDGFVASVSHELRTPLTAIIGYGELLEAHWDAFDDAQRRKRISSIVSAGNRLQRLVSDLLLLNQLETEVLVPHCRPVQLAPLIRQAVEEVQGSYVGQTVDLTGPDAARIHADPDRTLQILANLIDNAAKYSPEGRPIDVLWEVAGSDVVVRVRDWGSGLSGEGREHLFTRFGRVPGSKVRAGHVGTGLGLYLGRLLAKAMGGDLDLEATGPQGSVFCLRLPQA